tara:strand:- start:575 stop:724 length:150 start_codon:yes stop_codon:yes gene_type:complete
MQHIQKEQSKEKERIAALNRCISTNSIHDIASDSIERAFQTGKFTVEFL